MVSTKRKTPLLDEVTTVLPYKQLDPDATNLETPDEFVESVKTIFGQEILEKAIEEPTLDRYLDGNPKIFLPTEEAYKPLVERLRRDRAANIAAEAKRAKGEKKEDKTDDVD